MFRHQVMFVVTCCMLLLTFAYADTIPISSGKHHINTKKTLEGLKSIISTAVQTLMKNTIGDSTGPLSAVGAMNKYFISSKKREKEISEKYEEMLKKKRNFEEIEQKVNQMSSGGFTEEIKQKLTKAQATASEGFQKLNKIEEMKKNLRQAIHEAEVEGKEYIAQLEKAFQSVNSLLLGNESEVMNKLFSIPALIGDVFSKISLCNTYADRVLETLNKLPKICTEADQNLNDALKELKEIEATQKPISEMNQPRVLGVKDAHGSITKDSTSVPSLLSNFACFAGVMMFTVMSTNYL